MRIEKVIKTIDKGTWIVFLFFAVTVFFVFRDLFNSYFVADEWFHFTHYLPLTKKSEGLFTAMLSPFISTGELSGGQHVNPIASSIFFLNSKLFGMNYVPYAVMSLLLHAVNSFLVFRLILLFLKNN
ncbi:MAG: hypothetical protein HY427_00040 [Candidatus Levybacteria bacterium]|nr:hypothetical protein [Candidatus Levybacteria bacterium]